MLVAREAAQRLGADLEDLDRIGHAAAQRAAAEAREDRREIREDDFKEIEAPDARRIKHEFPRDAELDAPP